MVILNDSQLEEKNKHCLSIFAAEVKKKKIVSIEYDEIDNFKLCFFKYLLKLSDSDPAFESFIKSRIVYADQLIDLLLSSSLFEWKNKTSTLGGSCHVSFFKEYSLSRL